MHMIAYLSTFLETSPQAQSSIDDIVRVAKAENSKRNITGVLFYVDGKFLQVIEGREEDLRHLMQNIERDPRHRDIEYLIDTEVDKRGFGQWNMDVFPLDDEKIFDHDTLVALTESFQANLVPRSDSLVFYYKTLLRQKSR